MADDPTDFWKVVAPPVNLETDAKVGDAVFMERHHPSGGRRQWISIITRRWVNDDGNVMLEFRDARPDDVYDPPVITIAGPSREKQ